MTDTRQKIAEATYRANEREYRADLALANLQILAANTDVGQAEVLANTIREKLAELRKERDELRGVTSEDGNVWEQCEALLTSYTKAKGNAKRVGTEKWHAHEKIMNFLSGQAMATLAVKNTKLQQERKVYRTLIKAVFNATERVMERHKSAAVDVGIQDIRDAFYANMNLGALNEIINGEDQGNV